MYDSKNKGGKQLFSAIVFVDGSMPGNTLPTQNDNGLENMYKINIQSSSFIRKSICDKHYFGLACTQ